MAEVGLGEIPGEPAFLLDKFPPLAKILLRFLAEIRGVGRVKHRPQGSHENSSRRG